MIVSPVALEGRYVRLEPLEDRHTEGLARAGADASIWRLLPYGQVTTPERMAEFVAGMFARAAGGAELPFVVVERESGRVVGTTRYLDIRPEHRGLEVGGTWYAVDRQRTGVNTDCKRLLLAHAFETLGAIRVQLKADERNERSRRAIERIGATYEGTLRESVILPDGFRRSNAYYSILDREWPGVRDRLDRLARREPV